MKLSATFALPTDWEVTEIAWIDEVLTLTARCTQAHPRCPLCGTPTRRFHSYYTRRIADLPCGGQQMCLLVQVRRCFCEAPTCERKIFAEHLAPFVEPSARVTLRLYRLVQAIGLATGGLLGQRLAERIGIHTSWMTILRRILALTSKPVGPVTQLGIDDFSFRRRKHFGTILVDLQSHRVMDLLPDRAAESSAAWLHAHPEIELVSRDRGGEYATGADQGAPQATQVADRFHIVKNLAEAVELALARERAEILHALQSAGEMDRSCSATDEWQPVPDAAAEAASLAKRAERSDRYQYVVTLQAQGLTRKDIARRVDLSERTVRRWLKQGTFPDWHCQRQQYRSLDPYVAYVTKRVQEGGHNGRQLWRELRAQGCRASERTVYRFLEALQHRKRHVAPEQVPERPLQRFSSHEAVWWFIRPPDDLDETERQDLALVCRATENARLLYQLVQDFMRIVHERLGGRLSAWLAAVKASPFRALHRFARGIERDKAAVRAGLSLEPNNGVVEGHVNKLKLIKRQGYGRSGFALLRLRVLHAL
jgi:transposase